MPASIKDVIFESDSRVVLDALCGTIIPPVSIMDITGGTCHRLQDFKRTQLQH
ncbi:hypothetical protein SO802_016737, partial [Lithocarpus litseifolius]